MQRGDDKIYHVEHIIKWNLQVSYPALFKLIQSILFFLNHFDQGNISRVQKQLQIPLTTNNILILNTIIIGIPLK